LTEQVHAEQSILVVILLHEWILICNDSDIWARISEKQALKLQFSFLLWSLNTDLYVGIHMAQSNFKEYYERKNKSSWTVI
jgi:hypothetical protein